MSAKKDPLYALVETYDKNGKFCGARIVDIYHHGTAKWLQKHTFWAVHNGCVIEMRMADPQEVEQHLAEQIKQLSGKYEKAA